MQRGEQTLFDGVNNFSRATLFYNSLYKPNGKSAVKLFSLRNKSTTIVYCCSGCATCNWVNATRIEGSKLEKCSALSIDFPSLDSAEDCGVENVGEK